MSKVRRVAQNERTPLVVKSKLMDAGKMVMLARKWKEVPEQIKCEIKGSDKDA